MEKGKQVGGSSSSFIMDLFGPKESSKSSSSSTGLFGSVFGPPSMVIAHHSLSCLYIFLSFLLGVIGFSFL